MLYNKVIQKTNNSDLYSLVYALPLFAWVGIAVVALSLLLMIMTACCPGIMTCSLFTFLGISFIISGTMMIMNLMYTGPLNDQFNPLRINYIYFLMKYKWLLTVVGIILIISAFVIFYYMCKY